jgi:uncharacterized protein (DUF697 family)
VNIKRARQAQDLVRSGAKLDEERSQEVLVQVIVEVDAPEELVEALRARLVPQTSRARLAIGVAGAGERLAVEPAADAVIVAGGGLGEDVRRLLAEARQAFVPTALLCAASPSEHARIAREMGHPAADVLVDEDAERLVSERLAVWLSDEVSSKRVALAHNFPFMRRAVAEAAVQATAWQNALIGTVGFVPGSDMPVMTANQIKMLLQIAAAYGEPLGPERIKELLAIVGGGFVFRTLAREIVGVVPVLGWAIKGGIGYSGTLAMGKAAIAYFERGADLPAVARSLTTRMRGSAVE